MADTNDNSGFDFSEFYGEEPGSVTYDSNGNYTGSVPESEVADPDNTDFSNWSEVNTDENGNITGWNDDFGNLEYSDGEVKYRDSKGEWQTFNNGEKGSIGHKSNQIQHILGAAATPQAIANLQNANPGDLGTALAYAETGKASNGGLASVILLSGTVPDPDSLRGLGYKDEDIITATNFATEVANNMKNGQSVRSAWDNASKALGDPYGTAGRNSLLRDSAINTVGLFGGTALSALGKLGTTVASARVLSAINGGMKTLGKGGPAAVNTLANIIRVSTQAGNKVASAVDKAAIVATLVGGGMTTKDATDLVNQALAEADKKPEGDSDSEETRANADKTPEATSAPAKSEPTAARSEPKSEPKPDTSKTDTLTFTNPFGGDDTGISIPKGPLEGTPLSGTGLPGHEPVETTKEGYETEDDDSGSDTLEESSPDTGVGTDTYVNPNDDSNNKGVGLGEEDPNKANYDNDKWNRGMEYVSTDVVSDKRIKDFITKTYKNDPILIRTVKILKTRK